MKPLKNRRTRQPHEVTLKAMLAQVQKEYPRLAKTRQYAVAKVMVLQERYEAQVREYGEDSFNAALAHLRSEKPNGLGMPTDKREAARLMAGDGGLETLRFQSDPD
jgi:hypothetical protein